MYVTAVLDDPAGPSMTQVVEAEVRDARPLQSFLPPTGVRPAERLLLEREDVGRVLPARCNSREHPDRRLVKRQRVRLAVLHHNAWDQYMPSLQVDPRPLQTRDV